MARYLERTTRTALAALCLLTLAGCIGGDDGGGNDGLHTGTLMHVGVENVHYETRSQSSTTNEDGEFRYHPGETLTFRVGNLVLAENVPAAPFLSPIDFTADARQQLNRGGVNDKGLQTHRGIEEQLAANDRQAINITRLLMTLTSTTTEDPEETLTITQRTIDQLNNYLATDSGPEIDFDVPVNQFARPDVVEGDTSRDDAGDLRPAISSPANLMLDSICFAPQGDDLCEAPPTRSRINAISDEEQRQELQQERDRILDERHTLQEVSTNAVTEFLERDTLIFKGDLESSFYLSPETLTIPASDNSIKEVAIKRTGSSGFTLEALEAQVEGRDWYLESADWQTGTVRFYHDGPSTEAGTVVVNFKVDYPDFDNYRWFQKTLRVHVN